MSYLDLKNLTPAQMYRWDQAVVEYDRIQTDAIARFVSRATPERVQRLCAELDCEPEGLVNAIKRSADFTRHQAGNPKSALFARLVDGKPALRFPPPLNYGQPNYDLIEERGPWDTGETGADTVNGLIALTRVRRMFDEEDASATPHVMIRQCAWKLVKRISHQEALVTFGQWEKYGFLWRLAYEAVPAPEAEAFIPCWHDPAIKRILTVQQLQSEKEWHIRRRYDSLVLAIEPSTIPAWKQQHGHGGIPEEKLNRMLEALLVDGKSQLSKRRSHGLPDFPDDVEIAAEAKSLVDEVLRGHFRADGNGALLCLTWRLHRIEPSVVTDDIYAPS